VRAHSRHDGGETVEGPRRSPQRVYVHRPSAAYDPRREGHRAARRPGRPSPSAPPETALDHRPPAGRL